MRTGLCCLLLIITAGCGHQTADQKLISDLGQATSWAATLDLATASWMGNRVPAAFMDDTIDAAQKSFGGAMQSIEQSKASTALRERARHEIRMAEDAGAELRGAVHRTDAGAAARARTRFTAAYASLHAIQQQGEQQ